MDRDWYRTFFSGIVVEMWRGAIPAEQTSAEADFLERALRLRAPARVLDVPCGAGRHAIELASRGHRPVGVDLSEEMLAAARAAASGREVEWRRAEMRDLAGAGPFDAAYCLGNSFGYLHPDASREFLRAVARSLAPGGRFVMDTGMAAESILPSLQEREWMRVGEILFLEENRYLLEEGCVETAYTFVRGGAAETRTGWQWVHTIRELRAMLAEAGLAVVEMLGSIQGEPFERGGRYLLLVGEKRGDGPG
jgi:SAM-dependent methyltransferase